MQIIWSQIPVDCSPGPFPLQSVTATGREPGHISHHALSSSGHTRRSHLRTMHEISDRSRWSDIFHNSSALVKALAVRALPRGQPHVRLRPPRRPFGPRCMLSASLSASCLRCFGTLPIIPTTSLSYTDQICPRRIAAFRAQATKGSSVLRTRKPL
jgi:hypothetical protein